MQLRLNDSELLIQDTRHMFRHAECVSLMVTSFQNNALPSLFLNMFNSVGLLSEPTPRCVKQSLGSSATRYS
jgi:hypothetical protein